MLLAHAAPAVVQAGARPRLAALLAELPTALPWCWAVLLASAEPAEGPGGSWGRRQGSAWHRGALARPSPSPRCRATVAGEQQLCAAELSKSIGNRKRQLAKRPLPSSRGWVCRRGLEVPGGEQGYLCSPALVTHGGFVPAGRVVREWPRPAELGMGPPGPAGGGGRGEGRR